MAQEAKVLRLMPMDFGDVLDFSIRLYLKHAPTFIAIYAIVMLPMQGILIVARLPLLQMAGTAAESLTPEQAMSLLTASLASLMLALVVFLIGQPIVLGAVTRAVADAYLGQRPGLRRAYSQVAKRFWPLIGAVLFRGLVVCVGLVCCLLPGIWLQIALLVVPAAVVVEGVGASEALRRSYGLVAGHWWKCFGVIVIFMIAVSVVDSAAGFAFGAFSGSADPTAVTLQWTVQAVADAVAGPLLLIAGTLLYFDLRIRKEGFDLQVMADSLGIGEVGLVRCPQCNTVNEPGARFCGRCGTALAPAPTPPPWSASS